MLNRLIRFAVASGAITALAMVVHIVLYYSAPNTNLYTLTCVLSVHSLSTIFRFS